MRHLYRALLLLHPRAFRRDFAAEMLWIFDQSPASRAAFIFDGVASLGRQWFVRSGSWKIAAALVLAVMQVSAGGLFFSPSRVANFVPLAAVVDSGPLGHRPITTWIVMCLALCVLGGLLLLTIGVTFWANNVRRRNTAMRSR